MKIPFTLLLLIISSLAIGQDHILPLWAGDIPNSKPSDLREQSEKSDALRISNVQHPSIEVYLPSKSHSTGKAVLICPGGGYGILAYDKEGTDVARWLNGHGIAGIVLKYRLPEDMSNITPHQSPLMDAKQGIALIRQNADKWNLNPDQVGVMGFSAGGHLASTLGTQYDSASRPDFMVLIYPVVTMKSDYTHMGSRNNLLGEKPDSQLVNDYSAELNVTASTPPTFIIHSEDDRAVPIENSMQLYLALKDKQVPAEMHTYANGGHGYGLAVGKGRLSDWPQLLASWIREL